MRYSAKALARGMMSYLPGYTRLLARKGAGNTQSARYCYSVWLRHLAVLHGLGLPTRPQVIAELGPGSSLGIGLAGLLTGARDYYALDVVPYGITKRNLAVLEGLTELFRDRPPIPDQTEFPRIRPVLADYAFPAAALDPERLEAALAPERLAQIRAALLAPDQDQPQGDDPSIRYLVPWHEARVIRESSVDMIYSQAVLEHVADLPGTYRALARWLKPGGVMSHQIDFKSHELIKPWNGHWGCPETVWKIIQGRRPYLLNREPLSTHLRLHQEHGFRLVHLQAHTDSAGLTRERLAPGFAGLSDRDIVTESALLVSVKE